MKKIAQSLFLVLLSIMAAHADVASWNYSSTVIDEPFTGGVINPALWTTTIDPNATLTQNDTLDFGATAPAGANSYATHAVSTVFNRAAGTSGTVITVDVTAAKDSYYFVGLIPSAETYGAAAPIWSQLKVAIWGDAVSSPNSSLQDRDFAGPVTVKTPPLSIAIRLNPVQGYELYAKGSGDSVYSLIDSDLSGTADASAAYKLVLTAYVANDGVAGVPGPAKVSFDNLKVGIASAVQATPTPTPTPDPSVVLFEDNFDGTGSAPGNGTPWVRGAVTWFSGGTSPVSLNGSGILHMVSAATNWDPYLDTRSTAATWPGTMNLQMEIRCQYASGLQTFGFAPASGNGNGRTFCPQPNGADPFAPFQLNVAQNTFSASVAAPNSTTPYVVTDSSVFRTYRITLDPATPGGGTGSVKYEVQNANATTWTDITPTDNTAAELSVKRYDTTISWMPWIMCQGWNSSGAPSDLNVDYVKIKDVSPPPTPSNARNWDLY